jgi:hypothetical protein
MNCQTDKSLPRPFLHPLRSGGRQLREVFKIFEVDISIECGISAVSSELHIISQHAIPDDLSNFFQPLGKHRSPMQRLIDKHPKGVGILDTCYEDDGFLPIHRAASGGNLVAIIWFKNIGANTQLKSRSGNTALDISIIKLKDESEADLLSSLNGKAVFQELLQTFFSTRPDFLCNPSEERLSPLHTAAIRGTTATLIYVYKKASEIFRNSHIHCDDEHRIDTVYHAHFISLLQFGYTDQYWKDVHFSV